MNQISPSCVASEIYMHPIRHLTLASVGHVHWHLERRSESNYYIEVIVGGEIIPFLAGTT